MKHAYGKRMEYSGTGNTKLNTGNVDAYLGRKGRAGSENVIVLDTHEVITDESVETKENGGSQADFVDGEENLKKESEESQEDGSVEEKQQEKLGNEDDNADSHVRDGDDAVNNGASNEKEEVLDLPGQEGDNSLHQSDHRDVVDDSFERDGLPKDNNIAHSVTTDEVKNDDSQAASSDDQTIENSDNQTEISENLNEGSEHSEAGGETAGNTTIDDAKTDAIADDESHSNEQKDAASTNTETFEREIIETQSNNTAEGDTTVALPTETANAETELNKELADPSVSTEGDSVVMPDSNDTTKPDEFGSQTDNASGNNISEEEKVEKISDEKPFVADDQKNTQREEVGAQGDNVSDAEITANNASEEEKTDANNVEKIAMPVDTEDSRVEAIETQEGQASDAENTDTTLAEAKAETTSEDEVANSSQNDNAQDNSQISTNATLNEEVVPQVDGDFETQSTSDNTLQDTETHQNSNGQTNSEF